MWKRIGLLIGVLVLVLLVAGSALYVRATEWRYLGGVVRDADTRAPLAGVEMVAGDFRTITNERGEYSLGFTRGQWVLDVSRDGYVPLQFQLNGTDLLTSTWSEDIELTANRVVGYILDAETNRALANIAVHAGDRTVNANQVGAYELRAIKPGTIISVSVEGYNPATFTFDGQPYLNVALTPSATTVVVADPTGRVIPNARVQVGDVTMTTDAQGRAVLSRVIPGTDLRVSAAGFENAAATAGANGSEVRVALRPSALEGTITDAVTGKPISNTLVYLGNTSVATNGKGAYRFDNVPLKATVTIKASGYAKTTLDVSGASRRDVKLQPFRVKGIHIPFGMPADQVFAAMDMIAKTELNAMILDVKAEKGRVGWDSQVPLAKEVQSPYLKWMDLRDVVARCRADRIYCIARMPVFQDTLLATTRPDLALRFPNGTAYEDNNSSAWTNAANTTVWDYNIALAKEVVALGFDEIQFDYIRFPGKVDGLYTGTLATEEGRIAAITGFLARAQKELRPTGVFISADVFGLTTATNDEQYTGQRLRDLGGYVDYISPMVYPDVWNDAGYLLSNGLGIANCTVAVRCPYDVIYNSYKKAVEKTTGGAQVRLWLQAYAGRGNFGVTEYKLQKKAAEDAANVGWMFWNGAGTYSASTFAPKQ